MKKRAVTDPKRVQSRTEDEDVRAWIIVPCVVIRVLTVVVIVAKEVLTS